MKIAVKNEITILQKQAAVRPAMKWYFVLTLTFIKPASQDDVTDPPVVLHMNPKTGFYEHDLNDIMDKITEQIGSFEPNESG